MNEAFEKWWSETVSRGYETKKLDEMYKVVTQAAFSAGQAESAARIAELETDCTAMAEALLEAHVKTWIKANAITIAAKYGEGK